MKTNHHQASSARLHEMEERFRALEPKIQDPAIKEAISVLHGMFQEVKWNGHFSTTPDRPASINLQQIADMYRHAPKMEGGALNQPLPVGVKAPEFSLPNAQGQLVSLRDFRGKRVLLVFYPLDWSPGCSQQLDLYQSEITEFEKRDVQLIGISVDSIYSHGAWAAVRGIRFPLLADFSPKGEVARKYQVYREPDGFSERALYLIDEQGFILYGIVSPFIHHVPDIYELYNRIDGLKKPASAIIS
jgi:peroxiredoxin